ncbi:baseplate J/gp47 family protein [Methylocaldum sp. MU1018]
MAEKDIIQNMIFQLGQSQSERMPEELGVHFADVDERSTEELLLFARNLAKGINYYRNDPDSAAGDWSSFFPENAKAIGRLLAREDASVTPHLALFLAFLELYKLPQELINRLTGRHLDFQYREVLRFAKKPSEPDKAHLLIELNKNAAPLKIGPEHLFSAGKDATGVEMIYAPTGETVVNSAKVDSLRSLFLDQSGRGVVRYAPIADSSDGVGGELQGDEPKWHGFGHADLPQAEVGFALASPVLRMKEGLRKITVSLGLGNVDRARLNDASLENAFEVFITGEKNWLGPFVVSPAISEDDVLGFEVTVPETEKAVIDYDAAIHGYDYAARAPIVQVLLRTGGVGYLDFQNVTLQNAAILVKVDNIASLNLESDGGVLDPKKAFLPFGPQPGKGSRFMVGYDEAFSKKLSEIKIGVQWKDAPANFSTHYQHYGNSSIGNSYFTASVVFKDGGSWEETRYGVPLFESANAGSEHTLVFSPGSVSVSSSVSDGFKIYALNVAGSLWAAKAADRYVFRKPVMTAYKSAPPEPRQGFMTFSLEKSFLHAEYRKKYVENVMKYSREGGDLIVLNEPYTPTVQSISLSYKAYTDRIGIGTDSLDDFANADVQFFHVADSGRMLEHGYQRAQFEFLVDKAVSLLPIYRNAGELLIGFTDLNPGDSVSVLFQVAEGSADPDSAREDIAWSVLCDNYWKPLGSREVVSDSTGHLRTSGIVKFVIPAEATTVHTRLPSGRIWIKAAVAEDVNAVCRLIQVAAGAIEVRFVDRGNDPDHLGSALEKGKIGKLKTGLSAVKTVKQPYASFGGRAVESGDAFHTRVSERLRHKNRCITAWDYERIVLEAFPGVHKVKCIPHAKEGSWLAPGHVLLIVIPDLKNKNAMDPLQPKVDAATIDQITAHVQERAGMQVKVKVKNPSYQKVQLDFKVRFRSGYEFNYYAEQLKQALIRFLSPWAYDAEREISFGGKIYKSVLLDFVEERDYVDYVTDFKLYSYAGEAGSRLDLDEVQPATPDAILVSAETHIVSEGP